MDLYYTSFYKQFERAVHESLRHFHRDRGAHTAIVTINESSGECSCDCTCSLPELKRSLESDFISFAKSRCEGAIEQLTKSGRRGIVGTVAPQDGPPDHARGFLYGSFFDFVRNQEFYGSYKVISRSADTETMGPMRVAFIFLPENSGSEDPALLIRDQNGDSSRTLFESVLDRLVRKAVDIVPAGTGYYYNVPRYFDSRAVLTEAVDDMLWAAIGMLYRDSRHGRIDLRAPDVVRSLNLLLSTSYEGLPTRGRLRLTSRSPFDSSVNVRLLDPVPLDDFRRVRKVFEIARGGMTIVSDGAKLIGLSDNATHHATFDDNSVDVLFEKDSWLLEHRGVRPLGVRHGMPFVPAQQLTSREILAAMEATFPEMERPAKQYFSAIFDALLRKGRGSVVVIHERARDEAARLAELSAPIAPSQPSHEMVVGLTNVDGAILFSPNAILFAFGVILDGMTCAGADPSRGARFNSAMRYVASSHSKCLALVVSDDGMANIVDRAFVDSRAAARNRVQEDEWPASTLTSEAAAVIRNSSNSDLRRTCLAFARLLDQLTARESGVAVYESTHKDDALLIRSVVEDRLVDPRPQLLPRRDYEHPTNQFGIQHLRDEFQRFATYLIG